MSMMTFLVTCVQIEKLRHIHNVGPTKIGQNECWPVRAYTFMQTSLVVGLFHDGAYPSLCSWPP